MMRLFGTREATVVQPLAVRERSDDRRRSIGFEVRQTPRVSLQQQRHDHDLALQQEVREEFAELRERLESVRPA